MYWCLIRPDPYQTPTRKKSHSVMSADLQAMWRMVILFRSILQGIVCLRICEHYWSTPDFFLGGLLMTRCTGHQYVIWQTYNKEFMLLSIMSHQRLFITHGSRLKTGWTFPVPLLEAMLRFMEHKVKKSHFSLFVAIGFVLVQKL